MGLDLFEIVLILAVALIVLGPDQLPAVVRTLAKVVRDLRAVSNDVMRELTKPTEYKEYKPAFPTYRPRPAPEPVKAAGKGGAELSAPVAVSTPPPEEKTAS